MLIASGEGPSIADGACSASPNNRPFEELGISHNHRASALTQFLNKLYLSRVIHRMTRDAEDQIEPLGRSKR
jgi:hypothetical protein